MAARALGARATPSKLWEEPERRRRLVRLCATVSGDYDAAEDLAQEAMLEAWRHGHKLHDPEGADRWLAAIARNVCLRFARRRGRDVSLLAAIGAEPSPAEVELEVELDRAELGELLDRALALVPTLTRDVLVHRYVHEAPHAEIAARLGLSEDAVSMRISRGRVILRRLLADDLGDAPDDGWRVTRVWCAECGRRRLLMRTEAPPGGFAFRCPGCSPENLGSEFRLGNPSLARVLGGLVRPTAILARGSEAIRQYFGAAAETGRAACTRCARPVRVEPYTRNGSSSSPHRRGLHATCGACGEQVSSSIGGLALAHPAVRRFRKEHPRLQVMPERVENVRGAAATVVRYQDVFGSAGVDVAFSRETLHVLDVRDTTR